MNELEILSPNHYDGRGGNVVTLIGIHTAEAPEEHNTAQAVAHYFQNSSVQASAHFCADNEEVVRCVADGDSAWTMPPTNWYSLNIELVGYAAQTAPEWNDPYSLATLDNAAFVCARWAIKYNIPVRHLTSQQIADQEKGLAGHVDVNAVFHGSTHVDPGPNFPWSTFLNMVRKHAGIVPPPVPRPSSKPNCTDLQRAVHTAADNVWGHSTDRNCNALIAASPYGAQTFPDGVKYAQMVVGTKQDGQWGPISKAALKSTVVAVQKALAGMGFDPHGEDGIWGTNTDTAFITARTACQA